MADKSKLLIDILCLNASASRVYFNFEKQHIMTTAQTIKQQQQQLYKQMIVQHLQTSSDAPWADRQYTQLCGIADFLKRCGMMTEEEEKAIIKEAQAQIHKPKK